MSPTQVPPAGRDRYIDTLRALALVRVVTYHLLAWSWLPLLFPSMGVMFALAGGLVAASLARADQWTMLHRRIRRLLPPLWAFGVILIPVMLWVGWSHDPNTYAGSPISLLGMLAWIVPFYTPAGSAWGEPFVSPLWYLSAYLWFLLLSPALLWLWRRWPWWTMSAPLVILAAFTSGLIVPNGSRTDAITLILATYGACWVLGFAHHEGTLQKIPMKIVLPVGLALMAAGAAWAYSSPDPARGMNIDAIPFSNAMYSFGFALLLLRCYLSFEWMRRHRWLDTLIGAINARAMTIYLWHNVAVFGALFLEQRFAAGRWYPYGEDGLSRVTQYVIVWALIAVAVLLLGWVEDVAARRAPRLLPWRRSTVTTADPTTSLRRQSAREPRAETRTRVPPSPPSDIDAPTLVMSDLRKRRNMERVP